MTKNKILKATHSGVIKIGDTNLPCYVLQDGSRVLTQTDAVKSLGMGRFAQLPKFASNNRLKPFISESLSDLLTNPIEFRLPHAGKSGLGYQGIILADICKAILAARYAGALQKSQLHIAQQCEILNDSFAKVGIIALIDEATGYQKERDDDSLQKLLAIYLSEEKLKWAKTFPDSYYKELFRLRGWSYNPINSKRSGLVGRLTNTLVYEKLPEGVLDKLRELNPIDPSTKRRKSKHFQHLTPEIGQPDLRDHLLQLIAIMRASSNWRKFQTNFARAFPSPKNPHQENFDFMHDEEN